MSPARRATFAAAAVSLGLFGAALTAELAVRALDPPGSRPKPPAPATWVPGMGAGRAGVTELVIGGAVTRVPYRTNALGYRDRDHAKEKAPGTSRVAILGDSFLAGLAVPQEEIFSARLDALGGPGREVLAFGAPGYGTGVQKVLLETQALGFSPDIVVLAFFQNDPWDNHPALGSQRVPYFALGPDQRPVRLPPAVTAARRKWAVSRFLNTYSRAYVYQKRLVGRLREGSKYRRGRGVEDLPRIYRPLVNPPIPHIEDAWRLTLALVDSMHAACEAAGARLVVMDIPLQEAVSPSRLAYAVGRFPALAKLEMDWDRSVAKLGLHCLRAGIPYLDLRVGFRRGPDPAELYLKDDGHFTSKGHAAVARALDRFLRDLPARKP